MDIYHLILVLFCIFGGIGILAYIDTQNSYNQLEQNYGFCMDTLGFFLENPEHEYERPTERSQWI